MLENNLPVLLPLLAIVITDFPFPLRRAEACCFPEACYRRGGGPSSSRIVDGEEAEPHSIPWQVSLIEARGNRRRSFCGGSIISRRHILTAAHCMRNRYERGLFVMAGAHQNPIRTPWPPEPTRQYIKVKSIERHPDFSNMEGDPDVAILELEEPLEMSDAVNMVALADEGTEFDQGTEFLASGWGKTSSGQGPDKLQKVTLPWIPDYDCKYAGVRWNKFMVCAGDIQGGSGSSCQGDSGGPLTWKDPETGEVKLVGVFSYTKDENCDSISVSTKVSEVLGWIDENTK